MKFSFHYEGNTPSKKNQKRIAQNPKTGNPIILSSKPHAAWHEEALIQIKLQASKYPGRFPISRARHIVCRLYFGDQRRRDSSNTFESIMDLLVDAGILPDDSWVITGPTSIYPELRKGRPGWSLTILPYEPEAIAAGKSGGR